MKHWFLLYYNSHKGSHKRRIILLLCGCLLLNGCSSKIKRLPKEVQLPIPEKWQASQDTLALKKSVNAGWLAQFNDPQLNTHVQLALQNNPDILRSASELKIAIEQAIIAGAPLWPEANISLQRNRNENNVNRFITVNRFVTASFGVRWELDIWRKLTQRKKSAVYSRLAQKQLYKAAQLSLVANVSRAWYNLISQQLLLQVSQQELKSLEDTAQLIDESYQKGLRTALDVYLSRSDVQLQLSSLQSAQFNLTQSVRRFKALLGMYPNNELDFDATLPAPPTQSVGLGLPAQLLTRRPDIQASNLAFKSRIARAKAAHRDRFPSLTFSGSIGDSKTSFSDLFSSGNLAVNIINGLAQPLFAGGALKARANQAVYEAQRAYTQYLQTSINAFEEVENTIDQEQTLQGQFSALQKATDYAERGLELAIERYQAGLENYTTVLNAQRRLYTIKRNQINVHNALLQNRIVLHAALGGNYAKEQAKNIKSLPTISKP